MMPDRDFSGVRVVMANRKDVIKNVTYMDNTPDMKKGVFRQGFYYAFPL